MQQRIPFKLYLNAIRSVDPTARNVRPPESIGNINTIFFADGANGTFVYRFSTRDTVVRNSVLSKAFPIFDIPMPNTELCNYNDMWFERYTYCPDNTLRQYIAQHNPSSEKIIDIYRQILTVQYKLSCISTDWLHPQNRTYAAMYRNSLRGKIPTSILWLYSSLYTLMAQTGKQYLYHHDVTERNILVDKDGNVSQIIDLDTVSLSNEPFRIFSTLRLAPKNAHEDLMSYYEQLVQRPINRKLISTYLNLQSTGWDARTAVLKFLWRGQHPYHRR